MVSWFLGFLLVSWFLGLLVVSWFLGFLVSWFLGAGPRLARRKLASRVGRTFSRCGLGAPQQELAAQAHRANSQGGLAAKLSVQAPIADSQRAR